MKRTIVVAAALLQAVLGAQAAPLKSHQHVARISRCIAEQRASLAPLDRYGGYLPPNAPALMQQIMNPIIATMRTRCLPRSNSPAPPDAGWDYNSPTIAPPPAYEPSANNPACPGSIC
jgi:hypothetical protein